MSKIICWLLGHVWYENPDGMRLMGWLHQEPHNVSLEKRLASYRRASAEKMCERCGKLAGLQWEDNQ